MFKVLSSLLSLKEQTAIGAPATGGPACEREEDEPSSDRPTRDTKINRGEVKDIAEKAKTQGRANGEKSTKRGQ